MEEKASYIVSFLDYDGTLLSRQAVEEGGTALPPLPPVQGGYVFSGWNGDYTDVVNDCVVTALYITAPYKSVVNIYSEGYSFLFSIRRVLTATLRDTLDGELTFSFTALSAELRNIRVGCVAEFGGDYFNIVRVSKSIQNGIMTASVVSEHISYVLNEERYFLEGFTFSGKPKDGLALLLSGTQFLVGTVDLTDSMEIGITAKVTRRKALMQFIALLGGEIEYEGKAIGIRCHRGSEIGKPLMTGRNVTNISATYDSRAMTASFELSFHRVADFSVGDEESVHFPPLGLDSVSRIIAMEYNPFYRRNIRVEVGSYVPTIDYTLFRSVEKVESELEEIKTELSELDEIKTELSELSGIVKEVRDISVGETQFSVTFVDDTTSVYDYTVDSAGRVTSIRKVVQ